MTSYLESLNNALHQVMDKDERVYILGQDILDPYGGAFKVTRGLSQTFPERVLSTPISEAGMVGVGIGMALRGLLPVMEIMFGDFLALAADQLVNHAAKFSWMYSGGKTSKEQVIVPLVLRTPMGGRRGYGPTHSQTLEKLFLGVPGLWVLAPSAFGNPGGLLLDAILNNDNPVLFIENKSLYPVNLFQTGIQGEFEIDDSTFNRRLESTSIAPTYTIRLRNAPQPTITVAAYGYMAELARQAIQFLAYDHEVFVELVVFTQLAPFDIDVLMLSARRTHRVLVIEESSLSFGWGAEIITRIVESLEPQILIARRLAAKELSIPASSPLENEVLPSLQNIIDSCFKIAQTR